MARGRIVNIDVLRVAAAWLIVLAHVLVLVHSRPDFVGGNAWWLSHVLYTVSVPATPMFFLMSGLLVGNKRRKIVENVRHAIYRLAIPFVVFTLVHTAVYNWLEWRLTWEAVVEDVFTGGGTHLYFLVGLMVLYLLNPYLQKLRGVLSNKETAWLVGLLLLNTGILTLSGYVLGGREVLNSSFVYWFMAIGYFLYGASYKDFVKQKWLGGWWSSGWAVVGILGLCAVINYWLVGFDKTGWELRGYFLDYFSLPMILASIVGFNWLMKLDLSLLGRKLERGLEFLALYSYGVYLSHMMVLEFILQDTGFNPAVYSGSLVVFMGAVFGLTLGGSLVIAWTLERTPYLQWAVGKR